MAWSQSGKPAGDTVTISKPEFDQLKADMAAMKQEIEQLKQKNAAPAVSAPQPAESPNPSVTTPESGAAEQPAETPEQPNTAPPAPQGGGKSLSLPDISLVGQAKGVLSSDKNDDSRNRLRVTEIELGIQGWVYPNVKADAFLTTSPSENASMSVEEAYLTYLGLAKGLNLYVGEKHVPFGRTNLLHNHSWLYVEQPKVLRNLVASESLGGEGADLSYLIPTGSNLFAQLDLGTWTGSGPEESANLPNVVVGPGAAFSDRFNTARLWTGYPLTENSEVELGGSYAQGAEDAQAIASGHGQADLTGVDLSYRHFGEGDSRLLLRAENIWRKETVGSFSDTVSGYYLFGNWRWDKYNSFGLLYDWSGFPQASSLHESAASLIWTKQFSEQYYLRLEGTHGSRPDDHSYNQMMLQWVWGVGPHTHNLE